MEKLLKKGYSSIIFQLHSIQAVETPFVHSNLQYIISKHQAIFSTLQELLPSCGVHDHSIPIVPGTLPPDVLPYHHPFSQKNEIEKIIQEFLYEVLSILVPTPILLLWSWYSINKALNACVHTFMPSINSPSKTNFSFLSLMISWMN
jgi:hypothetical protein